MIEFLAKWQTLITASATLLAATIAWFAVQRQIANQRTIATRAEDDAFTAISDGSAELYGMLNLVWRAVDVAIADKTPEHTDRNFGLVRSISENLPSREHLSTLEEIARGLGPSKRRKYLLTMNSLRLVYDLIERGAKGDDDDLDDGAAATRRKKFASINLRTMLTHFATYLKDYDKTAADIFANRTKSKVDHRRMHEHLEPMVEEAERGENWLA